MPAANTDKLRKGFYGSATTLSANIGNTDTTIPLSSTVGLPTDTGIDIVIDRIDANGNKTPSMQETLTVVISGTNGTTAIRGVEGSAQSHSSGAVVEVLYTAATHNDAVSWGLAQHNQDGTHGNITATSITNSGNLTSTGTTQLNGIYTGWIGANESWTYSSYDSTNKTGVITVPSDATTKYSVGMRVKFFNNGATQYGIITAVASTSLTVYFGTDYSLTNSSITSNYYSSQKAPLGFPMDPNKWMVILSSPNDRTASTATPASMTDAVSAPIGCWRLTLDVMGRYTRNSTAFEYGLITLSTTTNTETDPETTVMIGGQAPVTGGSGLSVGARLHSEKTISVSSPTTYTMLGWIPSFAGTLTAVGSMKPTLIRLISAYL